MLTKKGIIFLILLFPLVSLIMTQCSSDNQQQQAQDKQIQPDAARTTAKVTFVELGSVNCIPCKMMQPVMKAIEEEFGDQIKVVFHDVWKDKAPAQEYGIKLIPTQIFLDENGEEFFRHEGFFPKEDIEKLLLEQGLELIKQVDIEK